MYMVEQKEVRASIMDRRGIGRLKGNVGRGQMLAIRRRGKMQVRSSKPGWRERNGYNTRRTMRGWSLSVIMSSTNRSYRTSNAFRGTSRSLAPPCNTRVKHLIIRWWESCEALWRQHNFNFLNHGSMPKTL
jgi:hypothetical protein